MSTAPMLHPDLREAARLLIATGRIRAEAEPDRYKAAVSGQKELSGFFQTELGWPLDTSEVARLVRLHKRRSDPPADRGPRLIRDGRAGALAPAVVLVLEALICEQLWRRPRMSLRELLQAIAQVCAAEATSGRLPTFRVVAGEGLSKKDAQRNRQHLVDALKLLEAEGSITVDSDLDRAVTDEDSDLVVSADRDRLALKFSSLSPTLLGLEDLPAEHHSAALCAEYLTERAARADEPTPRTLQERRLQAIRGLVDDPAIDPLDDQADQLPYLHTITGRERALTVAASLGLSATVRQDWWELTDPSGLASGIDFPNGRRTERQAALALLAILSRRPEPAAPLPLAEVTARLQDARANQPRWAAAYEGRMPALVRAAAAELVAVRLLIPDPDNSDQWLPTQGIHLWRAVIRQPPAPIHQAPSARATALEFGMQPPAAAEGTAAPKPSPAADPPRTNQ